MFSSLLKGAGNLIKSLLEEEDKQQDTGDKPQATKQPTQAPQGIGNLDQDLQSYWDEEDFVPETKSIITEALGAAEYPASPLRRQMFEGSGENPTEFKKRKQAGQRITEQATKNLGLTDEMVKRLNENQPEVYQSNENFGNHPSAVGQYSPLEMGGVGVDVKAYPKAPPNSPGQTQKTLLHEGLHDVWQDLSPKGRKKAIDTISNILETRRGSAPSKQAEISEGNGTDPYTANVTSDPLVNLFDLRFQSWDQGYGTDTPFGAAATQYPEQVKNEVFADTPNLFAQRNEPLPQELQDLYSKWFDPEQYDERWRMADEIARMTGMGF